MDDGPIATAKVCLFVFFLFQFFLFFFRILVLFCGEKRTGLIYHLAMPAGFIFLLKLVKIVQKILV